MTDTQLASDKIRIAIIGYGMIGAHHAKQLQRCEDAILCAVVDPFILGREDVKTLGVPLFTTVKSMLAATEVKADGAIVCTPNDSHADISIQLAAAGIHLLVEKPLSTDSQSGQRIIEAARKANVKLLVGHHRRFNPYLVAARAAVASLGEITLVNGIWATKKADGYFLSPTEWRQGVGGGPVLINMIHEIDSLQYLFGPIASVVADQTVSRRGYEAEEGGALIFRFETGVLATFVFSDNTPSPFNWENSTGELPFFPYVGEDFCRIFGTQASLSLPDLTRWSYDRSEEKSWWGEMTKDVLPLGPIEQPQKLQSDHFVRVIRGEEPPRCSGEDGLRAVLVVEAIKEAMKTDRRVKVPSMV
jgi:predicted dehydrogenase